MPKKPTTQIAHLVFADTQANAKKQKELFLALAQPNRISTVLSQYFECIENL